MRREDYGRKPEVAANHPGYACCMTLPCLAELLPRLLHPQVRDLAWVLLSPPLLSHPPSPQRHPLAASRWAWRPGELADWLLSHDAQPSVLEAWLAQHSIRRLGLYYERLWQFALAVKLYLGLEAGDRRRHDHWLGPGSHDRLDIKLRRLCEHQLQLPTHSHARALLAELTCCEIDSALWLGGYLFQPASSGCEPPLGANPEHLRGRWLRQRDWLNETGTRGASRWQPLQRQAWLAPARLDHAELWRDEDVDRWIDEGDGKGQARLLARIEPGTDGHWVERERLFVVPDSWPG